jgi:hypothetical protein
LDRSKLERNLFAETQRSIYDQNICHDTSEIHLT